jgi:hypothetical protein
MGATHAAKVGRARPAYAAPSGCEAGQGVSRSRRPVVESDLHRHREVEEAGGMATEQAMFAAGCFWWAPPEGSVGLAGEAGGPVSPPVSG